jgi:hypothetical protein
LNRIISVFWVITHREVVLDRRFGIIFHIFKGQTVQEEGGVSGLKPTFQDYLSGPSSRVNISKKASWTAEDGRKYKKLCLPVNYFVICIFKAW